MEKQTTFIPFGGSGMTTDNSVSDGENEILCGGYCSGNNIEPETQPSVIDMPNVEGTVMYRHRGNGYSNYIIRNGDSLCYIGEEDQSPTTIPNFTFTGSKLHKITSIGNTLLVLTSVGVCYMIYQNNAYRNLGTEIPGVNLNFGLQTSVEYSDEDYINTHYWSLRDPEDLSPDLPSNIVDLRDDEITESTNRVLAQVNKLLIEKVQSKGCFAEPFFVRYAIRLYDGTYVNHSVPILMVPCSNCSPTTLCIGGTDVDVETGIGQEYFMSCCAVSELWYSWMADNISDGWKDIVTSVDIFISKPIRKYDQSGKVKRILFKREDMRDFSVGKFTGFVHDDKRYQRMMNRTLFGISKHKLYNHETNKDDYIDNNFDNDYINSKIPIHYYHFELPEKSESDYIAEIENTGNFYLLKSIELSNRPKDTEYKNIGVPGDYLQSIEARQQLPGDFHSKDGLIANDAYIYNSRVNLIGIKRLLFEGYSAGMQLQHHEQGYDYRAEYKPSLQPALQNVSILTYLSIDGKTYIVKSEEDRVNIDLCYYLFYPNPNAYKMEIYLDYDYMLQAYPLYTFNLRRHLSLYGAYYFDNYNIPTPTYITRLVDIPTPTSNEYTNNDIVITSETNNPFVFSAAGYNQFIDSVLFVTSATKPVSEGQFGQYPLYVFTQSGIYALSVADNGSYQSKDIISRLVCDNPDSITQLDSGVCFSSKGGIYVLDGREVQLISDTISNRTTVAGLRVPPPVSPTGKMSNDDYFLNYIDGCRMVYDSVNDRIILYNTEYKYSFVYHIKLGMWNTIPIMFDLHLNSYPDTVAVRENKLLLISNTREDQETLVPIYGITRRISLGSEIQYKRIEYLELKGNGIYGMQGKGVILYGSRDGENWFVVATSSTGRICGIRGTGYRYFRIYFQGTLKYGQSITGAVVQYSVQNNRIY